jgi:hypothetical protein
VFFSSSLAGAAANTKGARFGHRVQQPKHALLLRLNRRRVCEARPSPRASRGSSHCRSQHCLKVSLWSRRHPEGPAFVTAGNGGGIVAVGSGSSQRCFGGECLSHFVFRLSALSCHASAA